MSIQIFNTLTRKKEIFKSIDPGMVKIYLCGPTVYGLLHVGNFRGVIIFNFIRHWLEYRGYKVKFIYNFTDIDDRIIEQSLKENIPASEVSEKYIAEFKKDFSRLKLTPHDLNPKVTETLPEILEMVQDLINKDKAYSVEGDVNYAVRNFADYGKLSNRNTDELMEGTRIEKDPRKKDPMDFALWKSAKPGEPSWSSPWGQGRPGWHIECSAMIKKHFGDQIDIHGGGLDLLFPHHENEIAQSEGCSGKQFVKYWVHNNMINFGGSKMSKSVGNLIRGREFMDQYGPEILKFMMMNVHYRSPLDLSDDSVDLATKALARIYSSIALADVYINPAIDNEKAKTIDTKFAKDCDEIWQQIEKASDDDFNSAESIAKIYELIRIFNSSVRRGMKSSDINSAKAKLFKDLVLRFGKMMSLFLEPAEDFLTQLDDQLLVKKGLVRSEIDELVKKRFIARTEKNYPLSDQLRKELTDKGIAVADLAEGSFWEVIK